MHELAGLKSGLCNNVFYSYRVSHHWDGPFCWQTWTVDWIGRPGQWSSIIVDGVESAPYKRPENSWHIYAPNIGYKHMDERKVDQAESAWFFFTVPAPIKALDRPLSVVVDLEERLVDYVRQMYRLQQSGEPGGELIRDALARTFLTEVLVAAQRSGDGTPDDPWRIGWRAQVGDSLLQHLDREVSKRLTQAIGMDDIARLMNMSTSSLAHRFKSETGMSVMERVRWLRIREARQLLSQRGATVKAVASKLCFCSPFHLSRVFREITGVTPQDWMRQQKRN
jgi:AraC-like DNA-binding protein